MAKNKLFYVGQKAFIDKSGELLILNDPDRGLDLPGGKIQEGEDNMVKSLIREVREETNLDIEVKNVFTTWIKVGIIDGRERNSVFIGYRCKYLSGDLKLSDEHNNFRWVNRDNFREFKEDSGYFRALEGYFEGA